MIEVKNLTAAKREAAPDPLTYDIKQLKKETRPLCWHCLQLCADAYQTPHGCILCKDCRQDCLQQLQDFNNISCPSQICGNTKLKDEDLQHILFSYKKKVEKMDFRCVNFESGCPETLKMSQMQQHLEFSCKYKQVPCKFCADNMGFLLVDQEDTDCHLRVVNHCPNCHLQIGEKDWDDHRNLKNKDSCQELEDNCPYCCDQMVKKSELKNHCKTCIGQPRHCVFKDVGCLDFDAENRIIEHEEKEFLHHQKLLLRVLANKDKELKEFKEKQHLKDKKQQEFRTEAEMKIEDINQQLRMKNKELADVKEKLRQQLIEVDYRLAVDEWRGFNMKSFGKKHLWMLKADENSRFPSAWSDCMMTVQGYKFKLRTFGCWVNVFLSPTPADILWPCQTKFTVEVVGANNPHQLSDKYKIIHINSVGSKDKFSQPPTRDVCIGSVRLNDKDLPMFIKNGYFLLRVTADE